MPIVAFLGSDRKSMHSSMLIGLVLSGLLYITDPTPIHKLIRVLITNPVKAPLFLHNKIINRNVVTHEDVFLFVA